MDALNHWSCILNVDTRKLTIASGNIVVEPRAVGHWKHVPLQQAVAGFIIGAIVAYM